MVTGQDNFNLINQQVMEAQNRLAATSRRLEDLQRQLDAVRLEMSNGFRELARLRLDQIQAGEVIARLNEADQATFMLIQTLKRRRLALKDQLEASRSRRQQLEEARKELARQRDEAGQALQQILAEAHQRLSQTEAYRQQRERAEHAAAVAKQAADKADRAETDRQAKGRPYEADQLFMYLWNRRFLTPAYRGGWLSGRLDGWVAKLIDFPRHRSNYHLLQELPRRLREHAAKVQQTAELERQALQKLERQAAAAAGALTWQAKVQEAEKNLKAAEAELAAEESRLQKLLAEEAELSAGRDPLAAQVLDLQAAALAQEPLASLYAQARATPRTEDDAAVARIQKLRQRQEQLTGELQALTAVLQQQQRRVGELEEVRRRYRQSGYDAYNSRFPGDFALAVLLGRLLDGLANPDAVWGEITRHHYRTSPEPYQGGGVGGLGERGEELGDGDFYTSDRF